MADHRTVLWLLVLPVVFAMLEDSLSPRRPYHGDRGDETLPPMPRPQPLPDWMPEGDPVTALGPVTATASTEEIRRWQFLKWLHEQGAVEP